LISSFIRDFIIAVAFLIVGVIASPVFQDWWDENIGITPVRLSNLLQDNNIHEFNNLRKQFHEKVEFDGIDLSSRDLRGANLDSIILRNVNLSKTNLESAVLDNNQISGDLSNITLRYASLLDAILTGVTLNDADLTGLNYRMLI